MERFGDIKDFNLLNKNWLLDSVILNKEECFSLFEMTKSKDGFLLYRATRDGFTGKAFHTQCDGKSNTITIIKNDLNYVFGGYTSSAWTSTFGYIKDNNAFLFSLRKNGKSCKDKFPIKLPQYALFETSLYGPTFGGGHDIHICNLSNQFHGTSSQFGHSYYVLEGNGIAHLGGNCNDWLTTEIEVYQINN